MLPAILYPGCRVVPPGRTSCSQETQPRPSSTCRFHKNPGSWKFSKKRSNFQTLAFRNSVLAALSADIDKQEEPEAEKCAWKDYWGNLVRSPFGYQSFPIEDPGYEGPNLRDQERWVKFSPHVGLVGKRKALPYAFKRLLEPPSTLIIVRARRPLGIVFEMDDAGLVRVVELVRSSRAAQQSAVARLGADPDSGAYPRVGDVLRAVTATTMDWGARAALLGDLSGSERRVVLFGADGQPWPEVQSALRSGLVADGDVEMVLDAPARAPPAEELEREAGRAALQPAAADTVPGALGEADSFNLLALATASTVIGLILAGFT
eukprot:CAMPEP_0177607316 /NCGR_PEP_ID=MMETSP0419_2-20121207/17849_1 /TAXON_ID=582737 /ORGANISM="Tetraselmis sp., Strain GSL018" /LENGTH=319 /DNA_ID=CAMNT_0019101883 /DNA_START=57 /DNA_END=1017 /DNA_ORIENTATION=-